MKILRVPTYGYASNCYLALSGDEAVLIDPSASADDIAKVSDEAGVRICAILLTHGHYDHMLNLEAARERFAAPLMIHESDAEALSSSERSLFSMIGYPNRVFAPAERLLSDGETVEFGGKSILVIHTPGHTAGSVSYLCGERELIVGDTLFDMGIGRSDFPSGDIGSLEGSLRKLACDFPSAVVYPGHGDTTDMEKQIKWNPYLKRALR